MKQYQYVYEDESRFIRKLCEVNEESIKLNASKIFIHIFSTNTDMNDISRLCEVIEKELPQAQYIGCTTNANILGGRFCENGIAITFSIYTGSNTEIHIIQQNLVGYSSEEMLEEITALKKKYSTAKVAEMLVSAYGMMESDLTKTFEKDSSEGMVVFGGGAYTGSSNAESFVFSKGSKPDNKALVAVFFSGDALYVDARHISGWKPLGHSFKITSADGNILKTLNDKPAFEIYSQYLDIKNNEYFEDNAIEFPFMCRTSDGKDILRTPIYSQPDGSIAMFSEIDTFDSVRLTYGDKNNISDCINDEARRLCEFRPDAIMLFSCVARRAFWAEDIDRESLIFQNVAPTSGFYTSGEIMSENGRMYHHNETLLIVAIREGDIAPDRAMPVIPERSNESNISFISRFAKFISTATKELEETNNDLDEMVKAVEESRLQAEAANQAKSDFLANMSHEIRTPINAILGFDTMILRESGDETIIKYANDIMRAGSNLLAIINDILDLSKIESGKMNIVEVEYELSSLVLDIANMMTMKAGEKGLKVEVQVDRNIPAWMLGDDVRIRQIIINLMNNAVKYTETGSVTLSIEGERDGEYEILHIGIKDTGIGIKPEDMSKLFEKFARIEEQRNHSVEGTGLGMNITIGLLTMMNSKLNVESEYGKGSCFSFDIRQKVLREQPVGDIAERSLEQRDETSYTSSFTAPDANVLVVDDNHMNREVIIALLKKTKIHFDQADGGLTCLEKTAAEKYDLILLDHMMPDLDGIKTLHRIREDLNNLNRETKIICMTANAISGAMEEYIWEGFDAYISKPVKPEKLERMLAEMLPQELVMTSHDLVPSLCNQDLNASGQKDGSNADGAVRADQTIKAGGLQSADDGKDGISAEDLPEINGIDIETALNNLAMPELVLKTMQTFMNGADNEAEYIMNYLNIINDETSSQEDILKTVSEYRIKVHAMKSSALTIGAVMVSNLAKFLEYSARDNNIENIRSVTVPFINEWRALTVRMKDALSDKCEEKPQQTGQTVDKEKLINLLSELNDKIVEMDIDSADELMEQLESEGIGQVDTAGFDSLKQAVMNIDIDMVDELVRQLKEKLC